MENRENYTGYKWEVFKKLHQRNEYERNVSGEVFRIINKQYEELDMLRLNNTKLNSTNSKLQQNNEELKSMVKYGFVGGRMENAMKEVIKKNREFSKQLTNLSAALDEKERETKNNESEIQQLKSSLAAVDDQYEFLKEEYAALLNTFSRVSFSSLEEQKTKSMSWSAEDTVPKTPEDTVPKTPEATVPKTPEDIVPETPEEESLVREKEVDLQKVEVELQEEPNIFVAADPVSIPTDDFVVIDSNRGQIIGCSDSLISRNGRCKFIGHSGGTDVVAWLAHSASKFATAGGDRKVKMWDFASGQCRLRKVVHDSNSSIYSIDFDPQEILIAAASFDGTCRIWTVGDMRLQQTLHGHSRRVMSAKFLGDKDTLVSGSSDRYLKIWDLQKGVCIRRTFASSSVNDLVTTNKYGFNVISGHFDRNIRFWDIRSNSISNTKISLPGRITSLDLSPDGYSLLSSVREEDSLQLIDFRRNAVVRTFRFDEFIIGCEWTRAKFSPDGQFCVCGSQDGGIYIWDVSTGALEKVIREHSSTVIACAWSWCGHLLSCDRNGYVILRLEI